MHSSAIFYHHHYDYFSHLYQHLFYYSFPLFFTIVTLGLCSQYDSTVCQCESQVGLGDLIKISVSIKCLRGPHADFWSFFCVYPVSPLQK